MNAAAIAAAARDGAVRVTEPQQPDDEADVDDGLARAIERRVHECAELARLASRAGERAVEQVECGTETDDQAGRDPELDRGQVRADDGDAEADQSEHVRRQVCADEDCRHRRLDRARKRRGTPLRESCRGLEKPSSRGQPEQLALARPEVSQDVATESADHLAAGAARLDDAGRLETVKMERDERL